MMVESLLSSVHAVVTKKGIIKSDHEAICNKETERKKNCSVRLTSIY